MAKETTAGAAPTNEHASAPDQDWGKIGRCVVIAIVVALTVHYVLFEVAFVGMNLPPTVHALTGMVFFFIAGFASFGVFY